MTLEQILQSGLDHHRAGRLPQAERMYRAVLAEQPNNADALHLLGVLANQTGHPKDACELIGRAIAQKPTADFYFNLAGALNPMGQRDRAIEAMRQAIALNPNRADAHANLGVMLHQNGQLEPAIESLRKAISLYPKNFQFHFNLGNALADSRQYEQAFDSFGTALKLNPKSAESLINQGNALGLLGRLDEALENFRRASELDPANPLPGSNYLFAQQFHNDDPDLLLAEHRQWNHRYAASFKPPDSFPNNRDPHRRLRIGYVSPEFRHHCQALFTSALFPHHDHEQFEIYCYSSIPMPDAITERLQKHADVWRPITHLTDDAAVELIRADQIDILVDLTMHMAHARPLLFARKPAPVQVCWLAYPGTTGMSAMDCRLTDPYLDPPGFEKRYAEKSIHLPETFWCYDPYGMNDGNPAPLPEPGELPALQNGFITFGCLNDFSKLNTATLEKWAHLMQRVDRSRLHLLAPAGKCQESVLQQLQSLGISAGRVEFIDRQPRPAYLAEYRRIDLCLDTLPYNGHTTSLDAFWMGVPVLTQIGRTVVGRAGFSQLSNLQLPDFAADTEEQFLALGQRWANDFPALTEMRRTLRDRMTASPLMDGQRFARNMESAFRQMWASWIAQKINP